MVRLPKGQDTGAVKAVEPGCVGNAVERIIRVTGTVQGVGYRPFVKRTAERLSVAGWVLNDSEGVQIHAWADAHAMQEFIDALSAQAPGAACVLSVETEEPAQPRQGPQAFEIRQSSESTGAVTAGIPADLAVCPECRSELGDPSDRRYRYPFVNCTQCGPRYSILTGLPYDRPRTSMRAFRMCAACEAEYHDREGRRLHAQPNACPKCGPRLLLEDATGRRLAQEESALQGALDALKAGKIVAVKGIGGFHLMCDARSEAAVSDLRRRKHRDEKPFAVMFDSLASLREVAEVSEEEARILESPQSPIVLVVRKVGPGIAASVAPGNPWIGALLPYSPLHVLLLEGFKGPLVATSANLSEEPICTDNDEARERLGGMADRFLCNDRAVEHPVDDSVVRLGRGGTPVVLRRSRGYAPSPLSLPGRFAEPLVCVGAHMKNTIAVAAGSRLVLSPHIGDLGNAATQKAFTRTIEVMRELHQESFARVAHDKHPDYLSTSYACASNLPTVGVQHHLAHVLACLLDNAHPAEDVLGVAWDGTGYGEDGSVWGGEFLHLAGGTARRFAHLATFRLPGGEAAVRDARRVALALAWEMGGREGLAQSGAALGLTEIEQGVLSAMLEQGLNAPVCSSAGRLFDAAAALLGIGRHNRFEGQLPLALESAAMADLGGREQIAFGFQPPTDGMPGIVDWKPAVAALAGGAREPGSTAAAFHRGLACAIGTVAESCGAGTVALTGGCFQNALLLDLARGELESRGFRVLVHRSLSPNDGSIAAGQALGVLLNLTDVAT